jgi:uncharacterized protein
MDRIDVFAVARSGAQWEGRLALARMPRLGASLFLEDPADGAGAVQYHCGGYLDAQGRPALRLALQAVLPLRCDRCTRRLAFVLEAERNFYFVASSAQLAAIPIDDAAEEALLGSAQFDLAGLIEDEAILQLPLSPRHADCAPAVVLGPGNYGAQTGATDGPQAGRPRPFAALGALRDHLLRPAGGVAGAAGLPEKPQAPAAAAPAAPVRGKKRPTGA